MSRRVAVTGLGLVTPLAIGTEETWEALCAGKSGVAEITRFDASILQTKMSPMPIESELSRAAVLAG